MSTGTRIPLEMARTAAGYMLHCWGADAGDATIVGSARRGRPDVGDIEVCVPVEPPDQDQLFQAMHACVHQQDGLWAPSSDLPPLTIVQGLKPGFKQARVVAHVIYQGQPFDLPVEIYRFEPGARGWALIMRTGPAEFGRWFLSRWKRHFGTPQEKPASVEGFLVDSYGARVPIDDEEECFRRIGIGYVRPEQRDEFARRVMEARASGGIP